ncbi:DUF2164 domain-containing protein [uncultured Cohaesibacter sp.]|uniref:DUF2164 domain-containing protein n=1 Tax=uncultured Cohaesibacter sp. TaxID=1002546 RepID=UPI002AABAD30|nr:DUF2164 domain-containing protein [uncultured Cohaesibacter sp.]
MSEISFSREEKARLVEILQDYFRDEFDQDLGRFEAEFFLDHLVTHLGPIFYNKGLLDAQALLHKHMDSYNDDLYSLEKG